MIDWLNETQDFENWRIITLVLTILWAFVVGFVLGVHGTLMVRERQEDNQ